MDAKDQCDRVADLQDLQNIIEAKRRVIALFHVTWCPFCRKFLPLFEKHAEGKGRNFMVVRDDQEIMGEKYGVKIYPTVLFFDAGKVSGRLDGAPGVGLTEKQLVDFIASCP